MKTKEEKKDLGRVILFQYIPLNDRSSADCGDVYNWLLDYDKNLAELFREKYLGAAEMCKKELKKK